MKNKIYLLFTLSICLFLIDVYIITNSHSIYGSLLLSVYTVVLAFGIYFKARDAVIIHLIVFLATPLVKPEIFTDSIITYCGCILISLFLSCSVICIFNEFKLKGNQ